MFPHANASGIASGTVTRRRFIQAAGALGGGQPVVVLGASPAGLVAAYELAAWRLQDDDTMGQFYDTLAEPEGRVYFACDWPSYIPGWMEGAIQVA